MPWFTLPVTHLLLPLYEKCYITSFREGSPIGVLNHRVQNSTVTRLERICSLWKPTLEGIAALRTTLQSSRGEAWKTRVRPRAKLGKGSALGFHTAPLLVNHFPGREAKGKGMSASLAKTFPTQYTTAASFFVLCIRYLLGTEIMAGLPLEWKRLLF